MAMREAKRRRFEAARCRAFFDGLGRVLDLGGASRLAAWAPRRSDAHADRLALEGDWARIAADFARVAIPARQR